MSTLRRVLLGVVSAATVAALTIPGAAMAKGPGGGGGGGGEETTSNSLSVPAVFVGENGYGLNCDGTSYTDPSGDPLTGYEVDGYYYVQGVNKWQAQCLDGLGSAVAAAFWGDNLSGDAKLKVGSPIRVELGLLADTVEMGLDDMRGWFVQKLQPSLLDRISKYGTLAIGDPTAGFTSNPLTPYIDPVKQVEEVRVWAPGMLSVLFKNAQGVYETVAGFPVTATAEINATGRVVFGYNLRVSATGDYRLVYTFEDVEVTSVNHGGTYSFDVETGVSVVTKDITVIAGGGGGGRR